MNDTLSSTLEDYLEAIYRIEGEKRAARVRDICRHLGVAKSTVNAALKSLATKGLVHYAPYELITLTEEGNAEASRIVLNHEVLRHFLQHILLLDSDQAERIACEMEHAVDRTAIERFACFLAFMETAEGRQSEPMGEFHAFLRRARDPQAYQDCIERYARSIRPATGEPS
jgi:DtxR family transcriptional regulator, Mn-dependent transcriptional regulator